MIEGELDQKVEWKQIESIFFLIISQAIADQSLKKN